MAESLKRLDVYSHLLDFCTVHDLIVEQTLYIHTKVNHKLIMVGLSREQLSEIQQDTNYLDGQYN